MAKIGEITAVVGSNGVGKTSLLRLLSGTHSMSSGIYHDFNKDISKFNSHQLAINGVAYVPQGREIFPLLTVKENLEIGFICLEKKRQVYTQFCFWNVSRFKGDVKQTGWRPFWRATATTCDCKSSNYEA
tara:strand:+ start:186 stop:575 length:390 start_codon:yes stop_codon:yes gene_type:complete